MNTRCPHTNRAHITPDRCSICCGVVPQIVTIHGAHVLVDGKQVIQDGKPRTVDAEPRRVTARKRARK